MINLDTVDMSLLRSYELRGDLLLHNGFVQSLQEPDDGVRWSPLYWPKDAVQELESLDLDANRIDEVELKELGILATQRRTTLREAAEVHVQAKDEFYIEEQKRYIEKMAERLHKGWFIS